VGSTKGRKVSTQSLQSTTSVEDSSFLPLSRDTGAASASAGDNSSAAVSPACDGAASGGSGADTWAVYYGDDLPETTELAEAADDQDYARSMPWIKVCLVDG